MTDAVEVSTFEVKKSNWGETRVVTEPLGGTMADGEVLFRVDRLALTANNISYAGSGDALGYWGFFPAENGWGRIPAMGWGDVIASGHPEVDVGERVWGFFPFSTHLRILAGKVRGGQFRDVSPHRADYAPVYAQFDRAAANPIYEADREDQDSLLRGLYMTSWLVEDFLEVNDSFGAGACLITSASSKTSIALGHCVKRRGRLQSAGITSPGNVAFCERLGCYDTVLAYDEVSGLDNAQAAVLVDMAGSAKVLSELHGHFGDNLKHSCRIGATHYEEMGPLKGLRGPKPEFFFAPTHVQRRSEEIGALALMTSLGASFVAFRKFCDDWLQIEQSRGPDAVARTYAAVLAGRTNPATGQIVSMWPEEAD